MCNAGNDITQSLLQFAVLNIIITAQLQLITAHFEPEQGPHGTGGSRRRSTCAKDRPRAEMEQKQSKRDRARERRRKRRDTASEESKAKEKESDRYSHDTTLTS